MPFFLYVASALVFQERGWIKLGLTDDPYNRRRVYWTGCPPVREFEINFLALWETAATTREELVNYERVLMDHFHAYRGIRESGSSTEWFCFTFSSSDGLANVREFLSKQDWIRRELSFTDIEPGKKKPCQLTSHYRRNLRIKTNPDERIRILGEFQGPVIARLQEFLYDDADKEREAAWFSAPCGAGKTVMTAKAICRTKSPRIILTCPRDTLQKQWEDALARYASIPTSGITLIGGSGTTDPSEIATVLARDSFCMIVSNQSSHLLNLSREFEHEGVLFIFDEAHHMAGFRAEDVTEREGVGRTRILLEQAVGLHAKRLFMTYTPRQVSASATDTAVFSMEDTAVFGEKIAEIPLRAMINAGVLPDYNIWVLQDAAGSGEGIRAKAQAILEAWETMQEVRNSATFEMEEKPMLHHMIVFAQDRSDMNELQTFLTLASKEPAHVRNPFVVLTIDGSHSPAEKEAILAEYAAAPRAILVNCFVMGEGVDSPITNCVAFACTKHVKGAIVQMVLRAGRWFPGKDLFHVLLPVLKESKEELESFMQVVASLASMDENLKDQLLVVRADADAGSASGGAGTESRVFSELKDIRILQFAGWDMDGIRAMERLLVSNQLRQNRKMIQDFCIRNNIRTSTAYHSFRTAAENAHMDLPESPLRREETWFEFLHPGTPRIPSAVVKETAREHGLTTATLFDEWIHRTPRGTPFPTAQNILDGYFAAEGVECYAKLLGGCGSGSGGRRR